MIQTKPIIKKFLFSIIFISINYFIIAQTNTRIGQTYVISDIHSVHQFNVGENENRFMITNKSDNNDRENLGPDFHYFYEFSDGSYYIDVRSYINRENERGVNSSLIFKATKIYDDEYEPPLFQTGSSLSKVSLPNAATKSTYNDFRLKISHLTESIVLNEEYVIVVNLPYDIIQDNWNVLLLCNEEGMEIFKEGSIPPRPSISNRTTQFIEGLKEEFKSHYFFKNTDRNIFVNFKTDFTYNGENGTFTIKALLLNDQGDVEDETILQLELIHNAERAHDPNNILVHPSCFDSENKPAALNYTVNFENIGGAPATDVVIDVDIPDSIDASLIDNNTFSLNYPYSNAIFEYSVNGSILNFTVTNINLRGKGEDNVNIDETKGNITYSLPLKNDIEYTTIKSNASILFKDGWEGQRCANCNDCDEDCNYPNLSPIITAPPAIATFAKYCEEQDQFVEDCLSFDLKKLEIRADGKHYLLSDGKSRMMVFKTKEAANKGLEIIKNYGISKHCFEDRPNPGLRYLLVDNDIPKGKLIGEDCIPISDPDNLTIRENSPTSYSIIDRNNIPFSAKTRDEAENIILIVKKYEAKYTCYVERPNPGMIYLRK